MPLLRLACLWVPLFPLAARLRSEPDLTREALAIFEGNGNAARLIAATRTARQAGLKAGLTLPQARALLPKLVARARDFDCERSAQEALVEAAESLSPRVEDAGNGVVYVDLAGLERHFPGDGFELRLAQALLDMALKASLPSRVGIASSKLSARVAAELPRGSSAGGNGRPLPGQLSPSPILIVPPGEEQSFLAPLPLDRLSPQLHVAAALSRWGIRSIGELAQLPAAEVTSRLGAVGGELHATARGLDPRPLLARTPPPCFEEGMSLEWPLVALEPFLFVSRAALDRLCQRLAAQGLAAKRLGLTLRLEPDGLYERTLELPAPTRDGRTLLTLLRLELEARPPGAPVVAFQLAAHPDQPREAQLSLFGPKALSPEQLATTLARLFALLGPGRCGSPAPVDGHRPERFALVAYDPPPPPRVRGEVRRGHGLLTVRVLRPPLPIEVLTNAPPIDYRTADEVAEPVATYGDESPPELLQLKLLAIEPKPETLAAKRPRIAGRVRVAAGPWRLEEEWWAEQPVERDYWDVELSGGSIYRIFRDRATGDWFADGMYD